MQPERSSGGWGQIGKVWALHQEVRTFLLGNEETVKGFEQESELYGQIYMNWNGKSLEVVVKASMF